jgi:TetR/AcrR family transcriptional repressor of nem operon
MVGKQTKPIRRQTAAAARERILREAEHLIHVRGYHCTSLDDIARRCGMTKANLVHHFRSKEELGLAVLDYKIAAYRCSCIEPCFRDGVDPAEAVLELFASAGRFYRGNGCRAGCFVGNIALEMSDFSERFREKAGSFFREWSDRIAAALRRHQAEGRLAADLDAKAAAESILALYEGASMLARTLRDSRVFDRAGRTAADLLKPKRGGDRAMGPRPKSPCGC